MWLPFAAEVDPLTGGIGMLVGGLMTWLGSLLQRRAAGRRPGPDSPSSQEEPERLTEDQWRQKEETRRLAEAAQEEKIAAKVVERLKPMLERQSVPSAQSSQEITVPAQALQATTQSMNQLTETIRALISTPPADTSTKP